MTAVILSILSAFPHDDTEVSYFLSLFHSID